MEGIAWLVRNRVEANKSWLGGSTYHGVIHHKGQFTSVGGRLWNMAGDPNALSVLDIKAYKRALTLAREIYKGSIADPTGGALFFHSGQRESLPSNSAAFFGRLKPTGKNIPPFYFYK